MTAPQPMNFAIAGLGGFARAVADLVLAAPEHARLVAVGDPALEQHADRAAELRALGVQVVDSAEAAFDIAGVEAAWLPLPIGLHRPLTEAAFDRGLHVLVEKPIAGDLADADAMIAARDRAGCVGAVGFHDLFHPEALDRKRFIRDGGLGQVQRVVVTGSWPRQQTYFERAAWAGRRIVGETAIHDSPVNNAMAHYVMLALFFLGADDLGAARAEAPEGLLMRSADIENFDTASVRLRIGGDSPHAGADLELHLTHADRRLVNPALRIEGTEGVGEWRFEADDPMVDAEARDLSFTTHARGHVVSNFVRLCRAAAGATVPHGTFEAARRHAELVAALAALPIETCVIPDDRVFDTLRFAAGVR